MKLKAILSMALASVVMMSSCSKDGSETGVTPPPINGTKKVYLQMNPGGPGTRGIEGSQSNKKAALVSAAIYFVDDQSDPLVYAVHTVGQGTSISMSQMAAGVEFENIPTSVKQVYIVGNHNSVDSQGNGASLPLKTGINLSTVKSQLLDIEQVNFGKVMGGQDLGYLLTVLDGTGRVYSYATDPGNWEGTATPDDEDSYASVTVSPINARIELGELSYSGELQSFTVEGIYINKFLSKTPLNLLHSSGNSVTIDNGTDVEKYEIGNASFAYGSYSTMYDQLSKDLNVSAGSVSLKPSDSNEFWAYHVFGEQTPEIPHIVVKFTNIVDKDGDPVTDRYITVKGLSEGGIPVNNLKRGKLYKINTLPFNDEDLKILPETDEISLWVSVEVEDWDTVIVTPDL